MFPTQDPLPRTDVSRVNGIAKPALASDSFSALPEICDELRRKVITFLEEEIDEEILRNVQSQVQVSIGVIKEALEHYRPEQLALSYNGGKDCLVLLILILACWPVGASTNSMLNGTVSSALLPSACEPQGLQAVYISSPHAFPEVNKFVSTSAMYYHLDLMQYTLPLCSALEVYLGEKTAIKAIFIGTRRADPHGKFLTHFTPTDKGWPQFMRINPLIDWHYAEIWAFIRHLNIPFCNLYNLGYTSLGGVLDTHRNPVLALNANATIFRPAYELMDEDKERLGRNY